MGGALWACLLLCHLLDLGPAAAQFSGRVAGTLVDVDPSTRTAHVGSSEGLQAALSPKVLPRVDSIVIARDLLLDPLAFVPALTVAKTLSICGAGGGVVLTALERFEVLNATAALTVCNVAFDLPFRAPPGSTVRDLLLHVHPGGAVRFVDVEFRLDNETLGRLAKNLSHHSGGAPKGGFQRVDADDRMGAAYLLNVTFSRGKNVPLEVVDPVPVVNDPSGFRRLGVASSRGDEPMEFSIQGNYTVTQCMLDEFNGGEPYRVGRPVTFRGLGAPWMAFGSRLRDRGFLDVEGQLRLVDMNVDMVARREHLAEGAGCLAGVACSFGPAPGKADPTGSKGAIRFDGRPPGCRVVMKNAVAVYGCEFLVRVHSVHKRHAIRSIFLGGAGEFVEVADMTYIDNSTTYFDKFMGGGICLQNVTVTCRPRAVENAHLVPCMEEGLDVGQATEPPEKAAVPPGPGLAPSSVDSPSPVVSPELTGVTEEAGDSGETARSTVFAGLVAVGAATLTALALLIVWRTLVAYSKCGAGPRSSVGSPWPASRSKSRGSAGFGILPRRSPGEEPQGGNQDDDVRMLDTAAPRSETNGLEIRTDDGR